MVVRVDLADGLVDGADVADSDPARWLVRGGSIRMRDRAAPAPSVTKARRSTACSCSGPFATAADATCRAGLLTTGGMCPISPWSRRWCPFRARVGDRGDHLLAADRSGDAEFTHETFDRAAGHRDTLAVQVSPDLPGAVDTVVGLVRLGDQRLELGVADAKFLDGVREQANRLIEQSMQEWERISRGAESEG
ncbi:hypothetical protein E4N62_47565 [Streptomyces sp. MNU76]|nr:hypothetical protein [Streptomyces sp. MNU76]MCC9712208.1 hypothetical protein [Streptomyces sp. MNU76]